LLTVIGASNELPETEALQAFKDRFMFRLWIDTLKGDKLKQLIKIASVTTSEEKQYRGLHLTWEMVVMIYLIAQNEVKMESESQAMMYTLMTRYMDQYELSQRRITKMIETLKVATLLNGRKSIKAIDLALIPYMVALKKDDLIGAKDIFIEVYLRNYNGKLPNWRDNIWLIDDKRV